MYNENIIVVRNKKAVELVKAHKAEKENERRQIHNVDIDFGDLKDSMGRVNWKRARNEIIIIKYEELISIFVISDVRKRKTSHDYDVWLINQVGDKFRILARDLKQGNVGKLFKRYIKYNYKLNMGDGIIIGNEFCEVVMQTKIYDERCGHKAYCIVNTSTNERLFITEYDLFTSEDYLDCRRKAA